MLQATIEISKAALKSDPTLSTKDRQRHLNIIRHGLDAKDQQVETQPATERIIDRKEAARRLSCSLRMVDKLAASGVLSKFILPGRVRGAGFRESDLNAL